MMSHPNRRVSACGAKAVANVRCLFGRRRLRHSVPGWPFEDPPASPELFVNARGMPFSRMGHRLRSTTSHPNGRSKVGIDAFLNPGVAGGLDASVVGRLVIDGVITAVPAVAGK